MTQRVPSGHWSGWPPRSIRRKRESASPRKLLSPLEGYIPKPGPPAARGRSRSFRRCGPHERHDYSRRAAEGLRRRRVRRRDPDRHGARSSGGPRRAGQAGGLRRRDVPAGSSVGDAHRRRARGGPRDRQRSLAGQPPGSRPAPAPRIAIDLPSSSSTFPRCPTCPCICPGSCRASSSRIATPMRIFETPSSMGGTSSRRNWGERSSAPPRRRADR